MAHKPGTRVWQAGLGLALTLTGCASKSARPSQTAANANLRITLAIQPAAPRQLDPARLTVTLQDAQGHPVSGATVTAVLTMPDMDMGRNSVTLTPQAPGAYTGTGRFTMPGDWQAAIAATHGGDRAAQSFPISVQ